jgi:hypothetical protein
VRVHPRILQPTQLHSESGVGLAPSQHVVGWRLSSRGGCCRSRKACTGTQTGRQAESSLQVTPLQDALSKNATPFRRVGTSPTLGVPGRCARAAKVSKLLCDMARRGTIATIGNHRRCVLRTLLEHGSYARLPSRPHSPILRASRTNCHPTGYSDGRPRRRVKHMLKSPTPSRQRNPPPPRAQQNCHECRTGRRALRLRERLDRPASSCQARSGAAVSGAPRSQT